MINQGTSSVMKSLLRAALCQAWEIKNRFKTPSLLAQPHRLAGETEEGINDSAAWDKHSIEGV